MALFKVFRGPSENLTEAKVPLHDGHAYVCVDNGKMYVDVDYGGAVGLKRICLNSEIADSLLHYDGEGALDPIEIDDLVLKDAIIDIQHGGTGADNAEGARANLDVYDKESVDTKVTAVTTKQYSATLGAGSWIENSGVFTQSITITGLSCGSDGTVSPIISRDTSTNVKEYSYITSAVADTNSRSITFTASKRPTVNLPILIIDFGSKV